ncbi:MAG TPA: hypothetical protein VGP72_04150 [Planctomycetota bacterium]|jgi:hypothetical protein
MTCDDVRVALEDDGPRSGPVAEHLGTCSACAQYAQQLAAENRVLAEALNDPVDEARWQKIKAGLNNRLLNETQPAVVLRWRRWPAAAAAAIACTLLGGLLLYYWAAGQAPETASVPAAGDSFSAQLGRLQQQVRERQLLEDLEQLQAAFKDDSDAKSTAEDAELYVERLLALDISTPEQSREILAGIRAARISERLQEVRQSLSEETPKPVISSLESAAATLSEAGRIATAEGRHGK